MKKIKYIIWLIIVGLLGTIVYQNREFFLAKQSLSVDLISSQYQSAELPIALYFAAAFLLGWFIAYLFSLADRFKDARTIKGLQQSIFMQQSDIDAMKKDVDALKPRLQTAEASQAQQQAEADVANT
jgi:multidrug resistance efflux pump